MTKKIPKNSEKWHKRRWPPPTSDYNAESGKVLCKFLCDIKWWSHVV